jgi:hypothetical protein
MPTGLSYEGLNSVKAPHGIDRAKILAAARSEMRKHHWDFFVDRPPFDQGAEEVLVRGCTGCRKQLGTAGEFVDHLYEVALPRIIESSK